MPMMPPLVSAEEFAGYLQHDVDQYSAELALDGASGIVRDHCGWSISEENEVTWTEDGTGTQYLSLPTLYLREVTEVRIDGTVLAASEYTWAVRGQLYRAAGWPKGFRNIAADGSHGYSSTPASVRAVVLTLASRFYANPEGLRSKTVGAVSKAYVFETQAGDLSELQLRQIGRYAL